VKAYVAVTDQDWFEYLSGLQDLDEVNFWTPHPWGGEFRVLQKGELILFKLKSPHNAIAGGGFFEHYTELPISMAWAAFGEKNGAVSLESTRDRISRLRREESTPSDDYSVGCIVIVEPFFWPPDQWIPQPGDFSPTIVRGKTYDLSRGTGAALWGQVISHMQSPSDAVGEPSAPTEVLGGYGEGAPRQHRIGQGTFRIVITDVYNRTCAVTGERALPALDAAHIRPFREIPRHYISNGLLLRSDVHRLFDSGYITVTPDHRAEVSRMIHTDFDDGESYFAFHGRQIHMPEETSLRPDPVHLEWHNLNRYRG
jgi:putative restriction endonuclease